MVDGPSSIVYRPAALPALPPGCVLRRAQAADAAAIRALVRAARLDPTQLRWPQFWVITHAGRLIACGQLRRFPGAQELGSLVVDPAWRGQGLGGVLIRRLIQSARRPLFLECQAGLAPYYQRFGFVLVSWRTAPPPLKWKFGLSRLVSTLFRRPVAALAYRGPAPQRGPHDR